MWLCDAVPDEENWPGRLHHRKDVATLRCMESLGYGYTQDWRVVPVCEATGLRSTSSCLPGADVPVPSARLRLEGRYCAAFPSSVACSP